MKNILYIHAFVEMVGGFVLLINPQFLLNATEPHIQGLTVAKLYGILAFCSSIIAYLLAKEFHYVKTYKLIILTILGFHFSVGLYMFGVYQQNITPILSPSVLHLGLAILFLIIYILNFQKFEENEKSTK